MVFFKGEWRHGDSRAEAGKVITKQWPKPKYEPGMVVRYRKADTGAKHIGKIRYVVRATRAGLDFYAVRRLKNGEEAITFECAIVEVVESEAAA